MKIFLILGAIVAVSVAAPSVVDNHLDDSNSLGQVARIVANCADSGDVTTCLSVKGIMALNRAARAQKIELLPGVTFNRDPSSSFRLGKSLSENEIAANLPTGGQEKTARLFDLTVDAASNFLTSHDLEIKLPAETTKNLARSIEEGRGKLKKLAGPLVLALGAKLIAVLPLFLGGLVLLATKALVVAKVAFVLAAVLGIQKLLGSSGGSGFSLLGKVAGAGNSQPTWNSAPQNAGWSSGTSQGWTSGTSAGSYPYARSYDAQELAYNGQIPEHIQ
ncbi:osiris 14 [Sergentomyia squamirostris]